MFDIIEDIMRVRLPSDRDVEANQKQLMHRDQ